MSDASPQPTPSRPPAVAGMFYPGSAGEIERWLDQLVPPRQAEGEPWPAVMVPHAGWVYSGRLAAATLARVRIPSRAIIFCPRHRPARADWAVAPFGQWELPGGGVAGDPDLAARLADAVEDAELDADAHLHEHAIEVQLPILARLNPHVRIVGVTIGGGGLADLQRFGDQLADLLGRLDEEEPLLIISSDMNHFADEATTRLVDRLALDAMQTFDPAGLYRTVRENRISMCGMMAAVVVMQALRWLGRLNRIEEVGYATSAEQSGDYQRVVGYAGLLLG